MTTEEARLIYKLAWEGHLATRFLCERLSKHGDKELYQGGMKFADAHWQSLAKATGHPVPDDIARP